MEKKDWRRNERGKKQRDSTYQMQRCIGIIHIANTTPSSSVWIGTRLQQSLYSHNDAPTALIIVPFLLHISIGPPPSQHTTTNVHQFISQFLTVQVGHATHNQVRNQRIGIGIFQ